MTVQTPIEKNNYKEVQVAEYQFDENKYDFSKKAGAGEYDGSIIIFKVVDKSGKHILIPGDSGKKSYPYLSTTDRGISRLIHSPRGNFWATSPRKRSNT